MTLPKSDEPLIFIDRKNILYFKVKYLQVNHIRIFWKAYFWRFKI